MTNFELFAAAVIAAFILGIAVGILQSARFKKLYYQAKLKALELEETINGQRSRIKAMEADADRGRRTRMAREKQNAKRREARRSRAKA